MNTCECGLIRKIRVPFAVSIMPLDCNSVRTADLLSSTVTMPESRRNGKLYR